MKSKETYYKYRCIKITLRALPLLCLFSPWFMRCGHNIGSLFALNFWLTNTNELDFMCCNAGVWTISNYTSTYSILLFLELKLIWNWRRQNGVNRTNSPAATDAWKALTWGTYHCYQVEAHLVIRRKLMVSICIIGDRSNNLPRLKCTKQRY